MNLITLQHNRPLRIAGATRIECIAGTAWLTRTGARENGGDIFLRAGDDCVLAGSDEALVEALGHARIRVSPLPAPWRRSLARVMAVLSSMHERMRTVRFPGRRTPLAG